MRSFDFAPLYRATVGFDQIADMMDRLVSSEATSANYPPYNIEKTDESAWRVSVAVAGFSAEELNVEIRPNLLIVTGRKADEETPHRYLHRGIATRAFERRFHLADHVRVEGAEHIDGMLHVSLVREVPEALKPRRIPISVQAPRQAQVEDLSAEVIEGEATTAAVN